MNDIKNDLGEALCAIASVQSVCLDADLTVCCYALQAAHNSTDAVMQVIERKEQVLTDFAHYFELHLDQTGEFDAEEFLSGLAEFEGKCNGE
jgi:hypothetical protein